MSQLLKQFAENRINSLLDSNGLGRHRIQPNGNWVFFPNSIIHQLNSTMPVVELKSKLCKHLRENESHYIGYISKISKCLLAMVEWLTSFL